MDEYDELYGVGGGHNDSSYGNQDIYGDDQDKGQSYDPEKAGMYSDQASKSEDQARGKDEYSNYDQQRNYASSDKPESSPQQQSYNHGPDQGQAIESFSGQDDHEAHPSVASAANQDEGKMFVGGLNWETTDERLRDYFSKYGEVLDCVVMRDAATGKSRGFAFLTFADPNVVDEVASRHHHLDEIYETPPLQIDPKRAIPRDEQDKTEKIFVGGIHQEVDEDEFRQYFSRFGKVIDVTLMTDRATGRPRGFGFVTFESSQGVESALNMPGLAMRGKPVEVKRAMPKHRQQQQSHGGGGDSHGVAVNPYFNMYGKQAGSRYAGAASAMAGGNQPGRGGWYSGNNMYGNYYGGSGGYQNYQMMAAAAAAYYNRYMGYYANQQQQQPDYNQGYQDDGYGDGNDGRGNDNGSDDYRGDDQDRGNDGDQYGSHTDRYGDSGRGNSGGGNSYSRDPRRDPRQSSTSYSSGSDRNSRGNSSSGGGGAVYASQSNRNQHNYRPY